MVALVVALASLIGGLGSALLIGGFLVFGAHPVWLTRIIGLAVGTLLGAAFLGLVPEAIETSSAEAASVGILIALLAFFLIEAVLRLHYHERVEHEIQMSVPTLLAGDAFHHAVDGAAVGAAFVVSMPLGLATALAVAAHEIPTTTSDYAVLVEAGYDTRAAILLNALSALPSLPAALLAYWGLSYAEAALPYLLMAGAGAFIYVALADLVPVLHHSESRRTRIVHLSLVIVGVVIIWLLETIL